MVCKIPKRTIQENNQRALNTKKKKNTERTGTNDSVETKDIPKAMTALVFNDALKHKPLANFHISDIPTSNNQGPKTSLHTFGAHNWESKVWRGKRKQNTTAIEESLKTEHSHTHALTLYGHTVLQKKTSGDISFFQKTGRA